MEFSFLIDQNVCWPDIPNLHLFLLENAVNFYQNVQHVPYFNLLKGSLNLGSVSDFRLQGEHEIPVLHDGIATRPTYTNLLKSRLHRHEQELPADGVINFSQLGLPVFEKLEVFKVKHILHELEPLLLLNARYLAESGVDVGVEEGLSG